MDGKGLPYRVNVAKSDGQYLLVMRIIKLEIPSCDELLLPETVQSLANLKQGLVLVCGATGSGKSTTLAALIEKINCERKLHIVTLEDPIVGGYGAYARVKDFSYAPFVNRLIAGFHRRRDKAKRQSVISDKIGRAHV